MLFTLLSEHPWSVHSKWSTNGQSTCTKVSLRGVTTFLGVAESILLLSKEGESRSDLVGLCVAGLGVGE